MSLKFAILGILDSAGPQSGYDIKTYFESGPNHVWQADLPQIYRTLDQLGQAKQVVVEADPSNARNRKVYTITPAGHDALIEWLKEDFEWLPIRNANLLRVFFGALTPPDILKQQLTVQRNKMAKLLEHYRRVENELDQSAKEYPEHVFFWMLTLNAGLKSAQAWKDWCDDAIKLLEERERGQL